MARRKRVVFGLLGTTIDAGYGPNRWERWRPTVSVGQHDDLLVDRIELLYARDHTRLAQVIEGDLRQVSPETEVKLVPFELPDPWDFEGVYGALHDFAAAYPFRTEREDYLVHITTGTHVAQICMFLLCEARFFPAKLLQTSPPLPKAEGPGRYSVVDLDLSRYDHIASRFRKIQKEGLSTLKAGIATRDPAYNALIERVEQVAVASTAPLLLLGPTGAGKTELARRIYELKHARKLVSGEFVEVNCATLRGDGAMSALFGHVKGAFTGALAERTGLLRKADGGVLFLDEIGELGADEQAMLLRALEQRSFYPMGSDREVKSQFQLVAGTNQDLGKRAVQGGFRADLLARIQLWTFALPGLAERRADLAPNLDYELARATQALGRNVTMSREARDAYLAFGLAPTSLWTGNFRDLNASVTRMATLAPGGRITTELVREETARLERDWAPSRALSETSSRARARADGPLRRLGLSADDLDPFERVQLEEVLRVCARSKSLSEAGRALFAQSRKGKTSSNDADRLRKYLTRFGLQFGEIVDVSQGENEGG